MTMRQMVLFGMILGLMLAACGCKDKPDPTKQQAELTTEAPAETLESPATEPAKPIKEATQAFFDAALDGMADFVESELTLGVPADSENPNKQTALMLAAFNGHNPIIAMLIDYGADVNHADMTNRTALMYSSSGPFPKTVELLIAKGADVNVVDNNEKWTALMFAAAEGQADNVRLLLDAGAETAPKDVDGDTAESFAVQNGHTEVAKIIRDHAEVQE